MRAAALAAILTGAIGCGGSAQARPSVAPLEHDAGMAGHQGDVWVAGVMMFPPAEFVEMTEPPDWIPKNTTILLRFESTDEASHWFGTKLFGHSRPNEEPIEPSEEACIDRLNNYTTNEFGRRGGTPLLADGRHACMKSEMTDDMTRSQHVTAVVLERDRYLTFELRLAGGLDWSLADSADGEKLMRALVESIKFVETPAE